ncbi:DNA gyrase inhibitor YacG [Candidatus Poribacteria bacterium]|nr:DNA gyrase inhibitor YacG [Candidatus Poribacteria bacterium]
MKLKCSLCGTAYEFIYVKGKPLPPNFPFCSNRCKSIDLGKWLNEEYRISMPLPETDILTEIFTEFQEETLARILGDDIESE